MPNESKSWLAPCYWTLALVGVIAIVGVSWWTYSRDVFDTSTFDKNGWFARVTKETESGCYRGGMARDIRNRLLQPDMSQDAVIKLLGKPDWSSDSEFQYVLGMCSGIGIDYDNLHIYFDSKKKVISAEIIQH